MYFEAANIASSRPLEEVQQELFDVCGGFKLRPLKGREQVIGGASGRQLVRLKALSVTLDTQAVERRGPDTSREPGDDFFLLLQRAGGSRIDQDGRQILLKAGDMCLLDASRPSEFVYGGRLSQQVSLHLPRDDMHHLFGKRFRAGLSIKQGDPVHLAISAVLQKMLDSSEAPGPYLEESLLSLLGAYFVDGGRAASGAQPLSSTLSSALSLINRHAHDPEFGPTELAVALKLSPRTLQRHFKTLGETPGRRLLQIRLGAAHRRLSRAGRTGSAATVTDIAFACGFSELSHFYREFRKAYGVAPGRLLTG